MSSLVEISHLYKEYAVEKRKLTAVKDFNLTIERGETVGLVGESGCGKSTVGKALIRLIEPTQGKILFDNRDIVSLSPKEMKNIRRRAQIVFQDPYASLNPRMAIQDIIAEPLDIHRIGTRKERKKRVEELLQLVGLSAHHAGRFPHEFSGGQRQRIGIARALAVKPEFLICDEPISALDVSIQAQIVNLLKNLQQQMNLTYLFISHDLSMVKYLSDKVAVMYLGQMMELAPTEELFQNPLHPYTQALLSSIPIPAPEIEKKRERIVLKGEIPNPLDPPRGCPFSSRCPFVHAICLEKCPPLRQISDKSFVACHLVN